jgi:DNA-binding NarL/FixJ family response regulator
MLSRESIFGQGILTLLSQETAFDVVPSGKDLDSVFECIQKHRPDVVVINCDDPGIDLTPAVICILRERLGCMIIGLSLRDNKISIYRGEHKEVREVTDLLEVIKG